MNKKAQSQIITTVLIILLVLAAIVIVWQVVQSTVQGGANEVEEQGSCIGVTMEVTAASNTSVTVRRGPGSSEVVVSGYKLFVDGKKSGEDVTVNGGLAPLDTNTTVTSTLIHGQEVTAAPILAGGTVCPVGVAFTVA